MSYQPCTPHRDVGIRKHVTKEIHKEGGVKEREEEEYKMKIMAKHDFFDVILLSQFYNMLL